MDAPKPWSLVDLTDHRPDSQLVERRFGIVDKPKVVSHRFDHHFLLSFCFSNWYICSNVTGILFPLYFYPSGDCYANLTSIYTSHPTLPFVIIINPDSGPGTSTSDGQPACIPSLRSAMPKAKLIGYVKTGYGDRASSDVQGDVDTYAGWGEDILLDGIFFDEVSTDGYATYEAYSTYAKGKFGNDATLILNPGTTAPANYYSIASYVVSYESTYSDYKSSTIVGGDTPLSNQVVMIYSIPADSATSVLDTLLKSLAPNLGLVFLSDLQDSDVYSAFAPDWESFPAALAAADGLS
ncbi:spherulin 4-like cell surface protein [Pseudohyphozyma bogoriensis]|nr:spherulin 4-like cell surface protein [Pseudohyphozyma bogoriensis]